MVKITLPDGSKKEFKGKVCGLEVAKSISEGLARQAIALKINGELQDLTTTICNDSEVEIITPKSEDSLEILRHTTAHVFAQALLRLFPEAKITIGPATESGFYYDVDYEDLTEDKLPAIEKEMQKIVKEDLKITKEYKSLEEAKKYFYNNVYKQELIDAIASGKVSEEEKEEGS
ncbi:MAG: TGS domain-containing protein, partial [Nanoarchaeota archaeon]